MAEPEPQIRNKLEEGRSGRDGQWTTREVTQIGLQREGPAGVVYGIRVAESLIQNHLQCPLLFRVERLL